jgi:hypothetical protein
MQLIQARIVTKNAYAANVDRAAFAALRQERTVAKTHAPQMPIMKRLQFCGFAAVGSSRSRKNA